MMLPLLGRSRPTLNGFIVHKDRLGREARKASLTKLPHRRQADVSKSEALASIGKRGGEIDGLV
jgi:hypothetical protein